MSKTCDPELKTNKRSRICITNAQIPEGSAKGK